MMASLNEEQLVEPAAARYLVIVDEHDEVALVPGRSDGTVPRVRSAAARLGAVAERPARAAGRLLDSRSRRAVRIVVDDDYGDERLGDFPEGQAIERLHQRGQHARASIGGDTNGHPHRGRA